MNFNRAHSIHFVYVKLTWYIPILLLIFACQKEEQEEKPNFQLSNGLLVLNEGLFQHNNSSISWIDLESNEVVEDIHFQINESFLGDTGNDMKRYGGKVYIAVTTSSTVEVYDAQTFENIRRISMHFNGVAQQPRNIDFYNGKVYITSFDGYVNVLDTLTYAITERIPVGLNPDHLVIANNELFVSNSGGLNSPTMDSTVFRINLDNSELIDSYVVGKNPGAIVHVEGNGIYVVKRGDYINDDSELVYINLNNNSVENLGLSASFIVQDNNDLLIVDVNGTTQQAQVHRFNTNLNQIEQEDILEITNNVQTLYGIYPFSDGTYAVLDAMGYTNQGYVRFFDEQGVYIESIQVGLNPSKLLYYE